MLNYEILLSTLEEVQKGYDEYAAKASGLHARMELFDTYFGLKLSYLVFSAAEQFSVNLQAKNITIQEATRGSIFNIDRGTETSSKSKKCQEDMMVNFLISMLNPRTNIGTL